MLRKIIGSLTSAHLVTAVLAAVLVPGAAAAQSAVVIQDPANSARQAHVDGSGRLTVIDALAAFAGSPVNFMRAYSGASSTCASFYAVPSGKALVVKTVTTLSKAPSGGEADVVLYSSNGTSNPCQSQLAVSSVGATTATTVTQTIEPGAAVPAGSVLGVKLAQGAGSIMVYGYLVPQNYVP